MGYTHYFGCKAKHKTKGVEALKTKIDAVLDEHKDIIRFESDVDKPTLCEVKDGELLIRFNGIGEDGHETFYFNSADGDFDEFCKTARKPYDIVVCKVLLLLFDFYGKTTLNLDSDGFSGIQPTDKPNYRVGHMVYSEDMDGEWANVLKWYNENPYNSKKILLRVKGVHGQDGCYFKSELIKA